MSIELNGLTVRELLGLEAGIVTELRARGLVRSNNKPLGDIAEQVVLAARRGVLEPNSTKSHDITTPAGSRIQVKAMGQRSVGIGGKFSAFRSFDFDSAIFLVFSGDPIEVSIAREIPFQEVAAIPGFSTHTNSSQPTLRQIRSLGVDVTDEMRAAFERLDKPPDIPRD